MDDSYHGLIHYQGRMESSRHQRTLSGLTDIVRQLNHDGGDTLAHGLPWLMTAVKEWYVACPDGCANPTFYLLQIWTGHYLDLRVASLDIVILGVLLVLVPLTLGQSIAHSSHLRLLQIVSFGLGVVFAAALFVYPITLNYMQSWVSLVLLLLSTALVAVGARILLCERWSNAEKCKQNHVSDSWTLDPEAREPNSVPAGHHRAEQAARPTRRTCRPHY